MTAQSNGVGTSKTAQILKADTKPAAPVVAIDKQEIGKDNQNGATPPAPPVQKQKQVLPPLDDRLHRLGQLFDLHKKFTVLQNTLQKLNEFEFKRDDETCTLSITDDRRITFTTSHSGIIEEVVEFLKGRIQHRVKEMEPKLIW